MIHTLNRSRPLTLECPMKKRVGSSRGLLSVDCSSQARRMILSYITSLSLQFEDWPKTTHSGIEMGRRAPSCASGRRAVVFKDSLNNRTDRPVHTVSHHSQKWAERAR